MNVFNPKGQGLESARADATQPFSSSQHPARAGIFLSPPFGEGTDGITLLPHLPIQTGTKPSCFQQGIFYLSSFAVRVARGLPQKEKAFSIATPKDRQRRDGVGRARTESPQCPPSSASAETRRFVRDQRSSNTPSSSVPTRSAARVGRDAFAEGGLWRAALEIRTVWVNQVGFFSLFFPFCVMTESQKLSPAIALFKQRVSHSGGR